MISVYVALAFLAIQGLIFLGIAFLFFRWLSDSSGDDIDNAYEDGYDDGRSEVLSECLQYYGGVPVMYRDEHATS